jgi:hypothetical protein
MVFSSVKNLAEFCGKQWRTFLNQVSVPKSYQSQTCDGTQGRNISRPLRCNLSGAALLKVVAECFQDRSECFGSETQDEQPQTLLTLHNMIVLSCAQFSNWIGMKVRPCMMGCNVAGLGIIGSSHWTTYTKRLCNPWRFTYPLKVRLYSSVHRSNADVQ